MSSLSLRKKGLCLSLVWEQIVEKMTLFHLNTCKKSGRENKGKSLLDWTDLLFLYHNVLISECHLESVKSGFGQNVDKSWSRFLICQNYFDLVHITVISVSLALTSHLEMMLVILKGC